MNDKAIWCEICNTPIFDTCDYYYEIPIVVKNAPGGAKVDYIYVCQDCIDDYIRDNFERSTF